MADPTPCGPSDAPRSGLLAQLRARRWLDVLPALVVYAGLCLAFVDYVPLWDGRLYFDCLQTAVGGGWFGTGYDCAHHPTGAYMWLLGLALRVAPDSYAPVVVANLLLGAVAIVAFFRLARALAGSERRAVTALATLAFAVHPAVTASTVQLTPDFGVMVFTLLAAEALARDRPGLAALWSVPAVFSKEAGLLLEVLGAAVYVVVFVTRRPGTAADKRRAALRAWPLLVPPLLYGGRALLRMLVPGAVGATWHPPGPSLPRQLLSFSFLDNDFPAALATILVLNYTWVAVLPVALRALRAAWRLLAGASPEPRTAADRLVTALFAGALLLLTRIRTYDNIRYYLAVFPLLLLVSLRSLEVLRLPSRVRVATFGLVAAAFLASNFRTTDPLSIATFGTFDFGSHRLLRMTSLTGECCGHGRDQLVYNLEFTQFHYLQDRVLADLRTAPDTVPACDRLADFWIAGPTDPATGHRTVRRTDTRDVSLETLETVRLMLEDPPAVRFIDYPNMDGKDRAVWLSRYDVARRSSYERHGYRLDVYDLVERPPAPPPSAAPQADGGP